MEKKPSIPPVIVAALIVSGAAILCMVLWMSRQTDYDKCVAAQKAGNAQAGIGSEGDSVAAFACAKLAK